MPQSSHRVWKEGPVELVNRLEEAPDGASSIESLDHVAKLRRLVAQSRVALDLAPDGEEGL